MVHYTCRGERSFSTDNTSPSDSKQQYRDIVVAKSTDGGLTFTQPVEAHKDKFLTNECVHAGAQMAIDSAERLHIAWYTDTKDSPGIYYAVSSDGGKTFSNPIQLLTSLQVGSTQARLAIDSKDNAFVVWENRSGQNNTMWMYYDVPDTKIDIAKITPDGQVFKSTLDVGNGKLPLIAIAGERGGVVWDTSGKVSFVPVAG
jgi:hypothetical protein